MTTRETESKERLLIEAAQNDPGRFAELYERNFHLVYAFVARRIRDRDRAQDVTADVFHQALANLPRFEWRGVPFAAWLLRIASNAVADHYKSAAREREIPDSAGPADPDEAGLEEATQRAQLFRFVDGLPSDQRRVIVMRFAEERPIREIARELARTEGSVKQLQFRALQNLRARMMGKTNG